MEIEYILSIDDYLQYQLYLSSKSKEIKRNINRIWLSYPLISLWIVILTLKTINVYLGFFLLVSALAWTIFCPEIAKKSYKNNIKRYIIKMSAKEINQINLIRLDNDYIEKKNNITEAKIFIKEIEEIIEIQTNFFIKIDKGSAIVLPKNDEICNFIEDLRIPHNIGKKTELKWKW